MINMQSKTNQDEEFLAGHAPIRNIESFISFSLKRQK